MVSEKEFLKMIADNEQIIHKVCNIYMHNKDDRKDLFQEIVLNAWKGIGRFRKASKFSTWLYRVALNTAITVFKKERKNSELKISQAALSSAEDDESAFSEQWEAMNRALQELSAIDKALVMLYFESYSHEEIAAITGITANNVAVKMNRIKTKLRETSKKFL